ncbi:MAG: 5-formyltetrahydrofolate cyclo-ligase [Clostridiales Family XIII bacterium]|jgi:5-formyltetrahydrofolate cyclo-ligase|nr:5-formyltetrahydrofolate cyclo-ligase [Clostridiales Family XIII bacterium]
MDNEIENKNPLREKYRAMRRETGDTLNGVIDRAIANRLFELPQWKGAGSVFVYVSVNDEVSTKDILERAFDEEKKVLAPRTTENGDMDAVRIRSVRELVRTHFGIAEPLPEAVAFPPEDIDLIIIPSLCIDKSGGRLGYGGGYYDKYISALPEKDGHTCASLVAIQRDYAVSPTPLPLTKHDKKAQIIVTEKRVIYL